MATSAPSSVARTRLARRARSGRATASTAYSCARSSAPSVSTESKDLLVIKTALIASEKIEVPGWLEVDIEKLQGTILSLPTREMIDAPVREQLIVELYSK